MSEKDSSTRKRIIDSAFSFYDRVFLDNVSLSMIAGRASISKAAIYKHFRNKEDLEQAMKLVIYTELVNLCRNVVDSEYYDIRRNIKKIIMLLIEKKQYLYFIISSSYIFTVDTVFHDLCETGLFSKTYFDEDGNPSNIGIYRKHLFISSVIVFFQIGRDKYISESGFNDSAEKVELYAESVANLILKGFEGNTGSLEQGRLDELDEICSGSIEGCGFLSREFTAIASSIEKNGFKKLTVESIASEMGLAKSSMYTKCSSKEELLIGEMKKFFISLMDIYSSNMKNARTSEEGVYILFKTGLDFFAAYPEVMVVGHFLGIRNCFFIDEETEKIVNEFFEGFVDAGIMNNMPVVGPPDTDYRVILSWIFVLPIFMLNHIRQYKWNKKIIHESMRNFYMMIENGIGGETKNENN